MIQTSNGVTCLYMNDVTANPIMLSTSFQTTQLTEKYDPYGANTETGGPNGATSDNPYLFHYGIQDRVTGTVKYGARWYDPTTGTWTQQDTLNASLDASNANRYVYAAADPINQLDPTGQGCAGDIFFAGASLFGEVGSTFALFTTPLTGVGGFFAVGGYEASSAGLVGSIGAATNDC